MVKIALRHQRFNLRVGDPDFDETSNSGAGLLEVRARVLLRCPWRLFSTQEFNERLPTTNYRPRRSEAAALRRNAHFSTTIANARRARRQRYDVTPPTWRLLRRHTSALEMKSFAAS